MEHDFVVCVTGDDGHEDQVKVLIVLLIDVHTVLSVGGRVIVGGDCCNAFHDVDQELTAAIDWELIGDLKLVEESRTGHIDEGVVTIAFTEVNDGILLSFGMTAVAEKDLL